jgi:hypothetical protein
MDGSQPAKKATKAKKVKKVKKPTNKKGRKSYRLPPPGENPFLRQHFNIFPASAFRHPRLHFIMSFFSPVLSEQEKTLASWKKNPFEGWKSKFPYTTPDTLEAFWSPTLAKAIEESVNFVRKHRFALRRFLHAWRSKRLTPSNTDDIVTLCPPKQVVNIVDWTRRIRYQFEASTLMRDITMRLLEHDGFFEDPQLPRNPLTNLPLTLTQAISVWNQLSAARVGASAAFSEFRRVRFCIGRFFTEYSLPLQLHAFRQTMRDPTHMDYQERLLDFIEYAYDQESIDCFSQTYDYCIKNYAEHELLTTWAKICTEFYEIGMIYRNNPQKVHDLQDAALSKTVGLLPRQDELKLLRMSALRITRRRRQISIAGRTVEVAAREITDFLNILQESL